MSGSDSDSARGASALRSQIQLETNRAGDFAARNDQDLTDSKARADALYQQQLSAFTDLGKNNGGVVDPAGSSGSGSSGGGAATPAFGYNTAGDAKFGDSENAYRQFMSNGGWGADRVASVDSDISGLKSLGVTGGITDENAARIRGGGVFDEFAQTGGLSDKDRSNIRSRATSVIPAAYARMQAEADRSRAVQGGYGPGAAALQARLMRGQQAGISDAALGAEVGITNQVNQGREWGADEMSKAELGMTDIKSRNQINSLTGAGNLETNMMSDINKGRMFGTQGLEGMAQADRQAELQRQGMEASAAAAAASRGQASSQFDAQMQFARQNASAQGLNALYTSIPAEYFGNKDFDLKNRTVNNQAIINAGNSLMGNDSGVNWGQVAMAAGTTAAAFA